MHPILTILLVKVIIILIFFYIWKPAMAKRILNRVASDELIALGDVSIDSTI
jgi:hypothetical protein